MLKVDSGRFFNGDNDFSVYSVIIVTRYIVRLISAISDYNAMRKDEELVELMNLYEGQATGEEKSLFEAVADIK